MTYNEFEQLTKKVSCNNCPFFVEVPLEDASFLRPGFGYCIKYPPIPVDRQIKEGSIFPVVNKIAVCAEHPLFPKT